MNVFQKLTDYLRQSREEVKKISWPSRKDTIRYSALVISVSVILAVFFAGLDGGFQSMWDYITTLKSNAAASQIQVTPTTSTPGVTVTPTTEPTPATPATPATPDLNGATPIQTPPTTPAPTK
ncbi:MAG: preprotein translocase subunit SecE [Patescibacteria group bacterium]